MKPLSIKEGKHFIEDIPLSDLVDKFGTPIIVYSKRQIIENIEKFRKAFSIFSDHEAHYAVKANYNPNILEILKQNGIGADAANPNEAKLAVQIGFDKKMITVTPNNLTRDELNFLVKEKFILNFDDEIQYSLVENKVDLFSIRINPGIGKGEFKGITTGGKNSKFGTSPDKAKLAYEKAKKDGVERFGIHMHTGSNVLDPQFFKESSLTFFKISKIISKEVGIRFEYLDIGGGYGVPYQPYVEDLDIDRVAQNIKSNLMLPEINESLGSFKLITEPGRFMVANSAVILSKVTNVKKTDRNFIGTNLSFNTMIRHALYGAKHHFEIMDKLSGKYKKFIITGQACENTDRLGENIPLIEPRLDDVLITYTAGAYITSMSSNYNLLGRPMEILVDGSKVKIIRKPDDLPSILGPFLT